MKSLERGIYLAKFSSAEIDEVRFFLKL